MMAGVGMRGSRRYAVGSGYLPNQFDDCRGLRESVEMLSTLTLLQTMMRMDDHDPRRGGIERQSSCRGSHTRQPFVDEGVAVANLPPLESP